jgi:putative hemolysin
VGARFVQDFLIILGLLLMNGVFAGAEIAILSLRKTRIAELADEGSRAVKAIQALRNDPERFLATVQIGITVVGTTAATYGGAHMSETFSASLKDLPVIGEYSAQIGVTLVVVMISFLELVLGELVPKSLALRATESYSRLVARPILGLSWLARPAVTLLTWASNVVLKLFGDSTNFTEGRLSPEELRIMVTEAAKAGSLDPRAGEIASRAIEFGDLTAEECMVPRGAVVGLPRNASPDVIRRVMLEENHSRVPIYEATIDHIIGYVTAKDVLAMSMEQQLLVIDDILRPAYFVPETMPAVDLLQSMQKKRTPIAIVVDELGSVTGIVTMEDLVEELVGEIFSEHDKPPEEMFVREAGGGVRVQGAMPVRDLNRELGLELPEGDDWTTVAGLCISLAGRIPTGGTRLKTADGRVLEVLEANPRRVRLVRIEPRRDPSPSPTDDDT